jgi:AGCS family alanine or glycine:cation symporter
MWKNTIATLFKKGDKDALATDGTNVSPFAAVATALASTVGVGNVAGVAGAIAAGGPGAVFWMWVSAFFGMCTKYAEIVLAVNFRQITKDGTHYGGPMYYIEKGLKCKWLACIFALLGGLACFGIGDATQAAEISVAVNNLTGANFDSSLITAIILAIIVGIVVIGGIKRISTVATYLVPFMAMFYIIIGVGIILLNITAIPRCFAVIFKSAFSFKAVGGGVFGYAIFLAMQKGVARGVFSNEAGLGSAPIAHAASSTKDPVKQGLWGIFEVFIDTIVICTITGLLVILSGTYESGLTGGALTASAVETLVGGVWGGHFVRIGLMLFALSTILGWCYYGETCWGYLTNNNKTVTLVFRIVFTLVCFVGAWTSSSSNVTDTSALNLMWNLADTLNGLMAIPNLIGLLLLSGIVVKLTKDHFGYKGQLKD